MSTTFFFFEKKESYRYFLMKTRNVSKGHGCPHLKNLKYKLLMPEKLSQIANTILNAEEMDRWTDRGLLY